MLQNHGDVPLISIALAVYDGDVQYFPRAFQSVLAQDLDHKQIQVLVAYDGSPSGEAMEIIDEATRGHDLHSVFMAEGAEKTGYYCVPRNRAVCAPCNFGIYQTNLDVDNEFLPGHLSGLLTAIRTPHPEDGWAHFVYSRREYVLDEGAPEKMPTGPSTFTEWTEENCHKLQLRPANNFIDTGDLLIGKGTLFELAERTRCIWNSQMRRFGDWDLVCRLVAAGFRGRAVDQVTHRYHWTGGNLQITRRLSDITMLPEDVYDTLKAQGYVVPPSKGNGRPAKGE